jgi:DNA repair protein RecO (recombination protein O)
MHFETQAIICAVRAHGEAGAIVRLLTPDDGLVAAYLRGGRSRTMRPVLQPGNLVSAEFRGRAEAQLPSLTVEPVHSRGQLMGEPLAVAAIGWVCALAASALPERHPYPDIYAGLDGMLAAIEAAPSARGWASGLAAFEGLILSALGYGGGEANLRATGKGLAEHIFNDRKADVMAARERLIHLMDKAQAS